MNNKTVTMFVALGVLGVSLWWMAHVAAEGIPQSKALSYTGMLTENSVPADGPRDVQVSLHATQLATLALCTTIANDTDVNVGQFTVELDDACTAVVANHPDVWVQVRVGATTFDREHLGATPYAVEAEHAVTASNGSPVGSITAFAGTTPPDGWIECDGRALDNANPAHAPLFGEIGTTWGNGSSGAGASGTTDFNAPDLRGVFPKGAGTTTRPAPLGMSATGTAYTGGAVGSYAYDQFQDHGHEFEIRIASGDSGGGNIVSGDDTTDWVSFHEKFGLGAQSTIESNQGAPRAGATTEPQSASVMYIIKL